MPDLPLRSCAHPGCPKLVRGQARCDQHQAKHDALVAEAMRKRRINWERNRETALARGYDTRWAKVRAFKMSIDPACEICNAAKAEMVHHKQPVSKRPDLRLELDNLMSVCRQCHEVIHKGERFGRGNKAAE